MSTFRYLIPLTEVQIDENADYIIDYDINLPHHKQIADEICESWNSSNMQRYYDGILKNAITECPMHCYVDKATKESIACVTFKFVKGLRLTEKYKRELIDQTSAQLTDGWGESFFGMINFMKDSDNNRFYVE